MLLQQTVPKDAGMLCEILIDWHKGTVFFAIKGAIFNYFVFLSQTLHKGSNGKAVMWTLSTLTFSEQVNKLFFKVLLVTRITWSLIFLANQGVVTHVSLASALHSIVFIQLKFCMFYATLYWLNANKAVFYLTRKRLCLPEIWKLKEKNKCFASFY